jgi:hypothetical protein
MGDALHEVRLDDDDVPAMDDADREQIVQRVQACLDVLSVVCEPGELRFAMSVAIDRLLREPRHPLVHAMPGVRALCCRYGNA